MSQPSLNPKISVVVCTHNRAQLLPRTLDSLATQTLSPAYREYIVVDDGSTDDTRAILTHFAHRLPEAKAIHQANAGLGQARNTGWHAARAPLVAFLDDDAIAPPNWLETIVTFFQTAAPDIAVLGGPIDPAWESPPPAWLTRDLMGWLSVFEPGNEPIISREQMVFAGANMTFRRPALQAVEGFAPQLGRKGTSLLSHEESAIWGVLAERGWANAYLPQLRVRHFTPSTRMTRPWFRRRLYWEGISMGRRETWPTTLTFSRRLRRWLGTAVVKIFSPDFLRPLLRPWRLRSEVRWQTYCSYNAGYLRETLNRSLNPRARAT